MTTILCGRMNSLNEIGIFLDASEMIIQLLAIFMVMCQVTTNQAPSPPPSLVFNFNFSTSIKLWN